MKLTRKEYSALESKIKKESVRDVPVFMRLKILSLNPRGSNEHLQYLGSDWLKKLISLLPSGYTKYISSQLQSVREKAKISLLALRIPHRDPENWPQSYRMQTQRNNARAGIMKGPVGQYLRLHPKGMSVRLTGKFTWNEKNGGDLHIMGTWANISKAITDGGTGLSMECNFEDIYRGDVNAELDEIYGPLKGDNEEWWEANKNNLPLIVSCQPGAMWKPTSKEGQVYLNAPIEVIALVVERASGVIGSIPKSTPFSVALDIAGQSSSTCIDIGRNLIAMQREEKFDKVLWTVTVGLGPVGDKYELAPSNELSGDDLLQLALRARDK
jgi:hypothetical protein